MTQEERNWIFWLTYRLQSMPKRKWKGRRVVTLVDSEDLETAAERLRDIATRDGEKLVREPRRRLA